MVAVIGVIAAAVCNLNSNIFMYFRDQSQLFTDWTLSMRIFSTRPNDRLWWRIKIGLACFVLNTHFFIVFAVLHRLSGFLNLLLLLFVGFLFSFSAWICYIISLGDCSIGWYRTWFLLTLNRLTFIRHRVVTPTLLLFYNLSFIFYRFRLTISKQLLRSLYHFIFVALLRHGRSRLWGRDSIFIILLLGHLLLFRVLLVSCFHFNLIVVPGLSDCFVFGASFYAESKKIHVYQKFPSNNGLWSILSLFIIN